MIADSRQKNMLPFIYEVLSTVVANGQSTVTLTLANDAVFELHHFLGRCSQDDPIKPQNNNFSVLIKDNGTGRELMNRAVGQAILTGPCNNSIREYRPVQFSPGTILEFTFNNLTGSSNAIEFALKGYKLFAI